MSFPDPDALLLRDELAKALSAAGYPTSKKTLDSKASRGGGPEYMIFGKRAVYQWGTSLAWAKAQASKPMATATEHRVARRAPPTAS